MKLSTTVYKAVVILRHATFAVGAKLLAGGTIIAFDDETQQLRVIREGSLLVEGDHITSVSDSVAPDTTPAGVEVINCTGNIITPGFIDTHRHGWQTVFRTFGSNTTLAEYFERYSSPVAQPLFTPEDVYISQLTGIYEALNAGVTTILDHAHHTWTREHAVAGLNASIDSGGRIFYAYEFQNFPEFSIQNQIVHWRELASTISNGLIALGIAYDGWIGDPKDPDTDAVIKLALENKVKVITAHDVEGPWLSSNNPELLHRLGLLNTSIPIVFSHASEINAKSAELLRQTNQHISITPESEMHYGHLHPTSHLILDQASLGVDTHFTFSTDILTQARLWLQSTRARLYKVAIDNWQIPANSPMSVNQAFLLATRNGGLALGRPDLGVLKPNATADILVWDGRSPGMLGWVDPISAVILHANVGDIKDVIVGGEFRKRDGKLVVEDYASVQDKFLRSATHIQAKLKEIPIPVPEGRFMGGYPYGPVLEVDAQRGEGTGYGPIYV